MKLPPALPPLVLALLAAGLAVRATLSSAPSPSRGQSTSPREAPCPPPVMELLGGLQPGEKLGDFEVQRISCGTPRAVDISLEGAAGKFTLNLVPRGALPHSPPTRTERCDLFYSNQPPQPPFEAVQKALRAMASRVSNTETRGLPPGW